MHNFESSRDRGGWLDNTSVEDAAETKAENIEGTGLGMKLRRAIDAQRDICRNGQIYM